MPLQFSKKAKRNGLIFANVSMMRSAKGHLLSKIDDLKIMQPAAKHLKNLKQFL